MKDRTFKVVGSKNIPLELYAIDKKVIVNVLAASII
jgi:hypothetical protein